MSEQKPLKVIAGAPDRPVIISDIEIPCYVLENEERVLVASGFMKALGRKGRPHTGHDEVFNLPSFLRLKGLKPFINNDLISAFTPIQFQAISGGSLAIGYRATLLPQVCEVYLKARDAGALMPSQLHIAEQAGILIRGLATVGVIALVDEATGYQEIRARNALATILEKFIAEELQPWTKTFPYEFYVEIFRLKSWPGPQGAKRPSVIGHYTNGLVYERLAPGLLDELRRINPPTEKGHRKAHQWFTPDLGHPRLKEHLAAVIALMRASSNWDGFMRLLERALPKHDAVQLALGVDE
jgi:hypothetical protein